MTWMDDPMMRAAALEGIASNGAIDITARLQAAVQANALLHKRISTLEHQRNRLLALCDNADITGRLIHPDQIRDILGRETPCHE